MKPCAKCGSFERYPPPPGKVIGRCKPCNQSAALARHRRKPRTRPQPPHHLPKQDTKLAYELIIAGVEIKETAAKFEIPTKTLLRSITYHLGVEL